MISIRSISRILIACNKQHSQDRQMIVIVDRRFVFLMFFSLFSNYVMIETGKCFDLFKDREFRVSHHEKSLQPSTTTMINTQSSRRIIRRVLTHQLTQPTVINQPKNAHFCNFHVRSSGFLASSVRPRSRVSFVSDL